MKHQWYRPMTHICSLYLLMIKFWPQYDFESTATFINDLEYQLVGVLFWIHYDIYLYWILHPSLNSGPNFVQHKPRKYQNVYDTPSSPKDKTWLNDLWRLKKWVKLVICRYYVKRVLTLLNHLSLNEGFKFGRQWMRNIVKFMRIILEKYSLRDTDDWIPIFRTNINSSTRSYMWERREYVKVSFFFSFLPLIKFHYAL